MNENKCIYCDFNHPDHIGAEIYSGEYIPEKVMYDSDWSDEFEYAYLKQKTVTLSQLLCIMTMSFIHGMAMKQAYFTALCVGGSQFNDN